MRVQEAFAAVETGGAHTAGESVACSNPMRRAALGRREPIIDVALEVDANAFEALFTELVVICHAGVGAGFRGSRWR